MSLEGYSARILTSQAGSRVNQDTDTITHIDLSYKGVDLSKDELIELLEQLSNANQINVDLVIDREMDK